jgi:hypothetical protein
MHFANQSNWLWLLLGLLACCGCKSERAELVPVSGQVLIDGAPLQSGYIKVIPQGSRPAGGQLDSEGRFTLSTYTEGDGVALGTHSVQIIGCQPLDETSVRWIAPKKYADYNTSGLTTIIDAPTNTLTFELTWNGAKPFVERN